MLLKRWREARDQLQKLIGFRKGTFGAKGLLQAIKRLYIPLYSYLTLTLEELGEVDHAMNAYQEAIDFCETKRDQVKPQLKSLL